MAIFRAISILDFRNVVTPDGPVLTVTLDVAPIADAVPSSSPFQVTLQGQDMVTLRANAVAAIRGAPAPADPTAAAALFTAALTGALMGVCASKGWITVA